MTHTNETPHGCGRVSARRLLEHVALCGGRAEGAKRRTARAGTLAVRNFETLTHSQPGRCYQHPAGPLARRHPKCHRMPAGMVASRPQPTSK